MMYRQVALGPWVRRDSWRGRARRRKGAKVKPQAYRRKRRVAQCGRLLLPFRVVVVVVLLLLWRRAARAAKHAQARRASRARAAAATRRWRTLVPSDGRLVSVGATAATRGPVCVCAFNDVRSWDQCRGGCE